MSSGLQRRSKLKRKTPLRAKSELRRKTELSAGSKQLKRTPLARQSKRKAGGVSLAAADRRWREAVLARDGGTCRCCGRTGDHAHHAAQRSTHPSMKHVVGIGITLCAPCHEHVHRNPAESFERGLLVKGCHQGPAAIEMIGPRGGCCCG